MNKHLNFTVPVDFVVQHARDMVLSANWRGALNCLMNGITGMTYDVAVRVLSGQSDFEAVDDGFKEVFEISSESKNNARMKYLELSRWQTGGCYQAPSGEIYQPYGLVEHFGQQDLDYATEQVQQLDDAVTISEFRDLRVRFFMKHRESDLPYFSERHGVALFRRVQGPAFWVPLHTKLDEALDAYLELRNLEDLSERPTRGQASVNPWQADFYREAVLAGLIGYVDLRDSLLRDFDAEALMAECSPASTPDMGAQASLVPVGNRYFISAPQLSAAEQQEKEEWLREMRSQVRAQATTTGGFLPLTVEGYGEEELSTVEVPFAPFMLWASRSAGTSFLKALPRWVPVAPQGLKMAGDGNLHSDWWLATGLPLQAAYDMDHPVNKAAWRFALGLASSQGLDFIRLAGVGEVIGRVVFPGPNETVPSGSIAVVPAASVDYEMAMLSACSSGKGAVISQTGGKLAHLATVARELNHRVAVVDSAMDKFKQGEIVSLNFEDQKLTRYATILKKGDKEFD